MGCLYCKSLRLRRNELFPFWIADRRAPEGGLSGCSLAYVSLELLSVHLSAPSLRNPRYHLSILATPNHLSPAPSLTGKSPNMGGDLNGKYSPPSSFPATTPY